VKSPALLALIDHLASTRRIDRFVIDEVHCVSHWGQDFRKDYLHLDFLKEKYRDVPLLCLTATATIKVKDDIVKRLKIDKDYAFFQSSFNRPNLIYEIRDKKQFKNVNDDLVQMLRTRFRGKSGIIYCISRKECEKLAEVLYRNYSIRCDYYHAELTHNKRQEVQARWMKNEIQIIIATIAFGMGINKKDVRFVIHYSMPKSLEGYVQECGRAGRDQERAECILYYAYGDRKRNDFFIITNQGSSGSRKNENIHALYAILDYCEEPYLCRRKMQLNFLGEDFNEDRCNKMCDNCRKGLTVVESDRTHEAQLIVRFIQRCQDYQNRVTAKMVTELLRGKKPKKNFLR
jgi:bloom syndrome protein